jgi:hypothetical protein
MPGAVEMYWQSDSSLLQVFCTGKMTTTETSKIKINVPISEHTAPHFIILSIYLMANSNHEFVQALILFGSIVAKLYDSLFETSSNLLL